MTLSVEQKKERANIRAKEWYKNNKERKKQYDLQNFDKQKEQKKIYRDENKERAKIDHKKWRLANKERLKEYRERPEIKKKITISRWKSRGLISKDFNLIYEKYMITLNCEDCKCEFGKFHNKLGNWRVMDHDHKTGEFRNIVCNRCNLNRGIQDKI